VYSNPNGGGTSAYSNPIGGGAPANAGTSVIGSPNTGGPPPNSNPNAGAQVPASNSPGQGAPDGTAGPTGAANSAGTPGEPGASDGGPAIGPPPSFGNLGNPAKAPKKISSTPALSRLLGNKDFLITINCYNDHVDVFPGGMSFRWTAANVNATDQAFAQAIANLIERRQASVRPGDSPYRPLICFRVTPDGRPSCLHIYPLLEPLHVPMTRENIVE
jgi:hypothetical protein